MKKIHIAMATMALMIAGATLASAQSNPPYGTGTPQKRGQQNKGKKLGPQDGSGPIHTPGTGGGTGAGQRRGRR